MSSRGNAVICGGAKTAEKQFPNGKSWKSATPGAVMGFATLDEAHAYFTEVYPNRWTVLTIR